jgi:3,4-dihydroxy 2-butanone 4-phosphate synthase/GTP cyclohydrolase II
MAQTELRNPAVEDPPGNRPWVTLSFAQSLDGCIAADRSQRLSLSGRSSLELTHRLRTEHDAILIGIGTLLSDNPSLTARYVEGPQPRPVILDSRLRTPADAKIFISHPHSPLIAALETADPRRRAALTMSGAEVIELPPDGQGRVSLVHLLTRLSSIGIRRTMVEGGARVITSFLRQRLVDEVVITVAPVFIGGQRAVEELLRPLNGSRSGRPVAIEQFPQLKEIQIATAGSDLVISGRVAWGEF